jgi:hypothetical protein
MRYSIAFCLSLICQFGFAQESPPILDNTLPGILPSMNPKLNQELKTEILSMALEDQTARLKIINYKYFSEEERKKLSEIEANHNLRLKEIISAYGWPGLSLVGLTGTTSFWLLVQHQDNDLEFQKQCLELLDGAVQKQDDQLQHFAYLLDRVRKNENLPQVYGTQWEFKDGKWLLYPVEEPENLNLRRLEAGLNSIEEYEEDLSSRRG